jgi:hypothetical protein
MPSLREAYADWEQLLSDIMMALDEEYTLAKRMVGAGVVYPLRDGKEVSSENDRYIYRFKMDLVKELNFVDAPVKIVDGSGRIIEGEILSIDGDVILLSLKDKPSTERVDMQIDLSFLLIELKKKLKAYRDHYTQRLSILPLKVFGYRRDIMRSIMVGEASDFKDLDEEQRESILNTSKYDVSVVCGPPGTGKSRVLARIAVGAIKKGLRVLIATHTHSALDRALKLVVEEIGEAGTEIEEGLIIRMGKSLDEKVARFEEDRILIKFSGRLQVELMRVYDMIRWCEGTLNEWYKKRGNIINASRAICEYISSLEEKIKLHEERLHAIERNIEGSLQKIRRLKDSYLKLINSKPSRLVSLFMKKLWEEKLEKRLLQLKAEMEHELEKIRKVKELRDKKVNELSNARNELNNALSKLKTAIEQGLRLEDLKKLSTYTPMLQNQYTYEDAVTVILENLELLTDFIGQGGEEGIAKRLQALRRRLNDINERLQGMRIEVRKKAKLIASTLTKCMTELFDYIKEGVLQRFDIALVDEVSMANLGLLWVTASIADRIVMFGDPNQLPPITLLNKIGHGMLHKLQSMNFFDWSDISYGSISQDVPVTFLKKQYRMGRRICEIVSKLFYGGGLENVTTCDGTVTFYNIDVMKSMDMRTFSGSRINGLNSLLVAKIIDELKEDGAREEDIAVVTPYRAQAKLIKEVLRNRGFGDVRVGTVHTFQGGEKKIVILDLVVRNRKVMSKSPILGGEVSRRLLSTSMSRAIEKLIIIGSWDVLKSSNVESLRKLLSLLSPLEVKTPTLSNIQLIPLEKVQISSKETIFFSTNEVYESLKRDIMEAKKYIVIVSAFVEHNVLLDLLGDVRVPVTVYIKKGKEGKIDVSKLPESIRIEPVERLHGKAVVIDDRILYMGSLNFLLPTGSLETVCRIEGKSKMLDRIKEAFPPKI